MTRIEDGGTWYILPTPFLEDLSLDLAGLHRTVAAAADWGCDGVTALGFMGEAPALSDDEREAAVAAIIDAAGDRLPVAIGCTASSAYLVLRRAEAAARAGAAAVMVAAPPFFGNVDLLPAFFVEVAAGSPLPLIVQDEPASTGVRIPSSVLVRILEGIGATVIKLEDPPTHVKTQALLKALPSLTVFGGLGGQYFLQELQRGARGSMTGFAFPEVLRAVRLAWESGSRDAAARIFYRYLPLLQFEAQPGLSLAVRKEVLRRRGVFTGPDTRGVPRRLDAGTLAELDVLLTRLTMVLSREPLQIEPE